MIPKKQANNPSNRPKKSRTSLSQYGLMDIPDFNVMDDDNDEVSDETDEQLEAELLALTGGHATPKPKKKPVPDFSNLDKMVQESLRDDIDDGISSGEDDDVLAELQMLQGGNDEDEIPNVKESSNDGKYSELLKERLSMYEKAEKVSLDANDKIRARRYARGITTLKDLIKKSQIGSIISEDDIPPPIPKSVLEKQEVTVNPPISKSVLEKPEVTVKATENPEVKIFEEKPHHEVVTNLVNIDQPPVEPPPIEISKIPEIVVPEEDIQTLLTNRQNLYKKAALEAKRNGDKPTALNFVRIVKQFDTVIDAVKNGTQIDIASLPPPPPPLSSLTAPQPETVSQSLATTDLPSNSPEVKIVNEEEPAVAVRKPPSSVLEALEERLEKFKEAAESAKVENNSGKVRRMNRIVGQYQDAIRLHKVGKPIPVDELPTPPGFGPIPVEGSSTPSQDLSKPHSINDKNEGPTTTNSPPTRPARSSGSAGIRNQKQLQAVMEKQKLFKIAALNEKQNGNIEKAKEYLRMAKGFDPMIKAATCGVPIDLTTLPVAPGEREEIDSDVKVMQLNSCIDGTDEDVYHHLHSDLKSQFEMCIQTKDHFKAVGDVANANRFEQLALRSKKDLALVQIACKRKLQLPKFHYETKSFSIIQCNTDLTDNDLEVNIIQGVNYNDPNHKELDTYVKVSFPYPTESPQTYKSSTISNSDNPQYNSIFSFTMQRNARACQRIFKRQAIKCEVWSKGGFFRSDSLLGVATVKLQPLETKCTIHDAFKIMDGRKENGGMVEIKVRIRNPIQTKQIEQVEKKWLFIDS